MNNKEDWEKLFVLAVNNGIGRYDGSYEQAYDNIVNLFEKQDKIIDLLINKLNQNYNKVFERNEVKEIIEIYEKIKNKNKLGGLELRKECIKQYFERKCEEC